MQNFTFRRKGINWFLFAFILFVGNLPAAQAQNCPTVTSEQESQNFCYLSRVSDLQATPNGDGLRWYRTATSTVPIPNDEILQDGSYFAGNDSGDCNAREEVTVTVDDLGPPTTTFGNFYEPCEYSSEDVTTVGELKALVVPSVSGYDINIYGQDDEFGTNELADNTVLVDGNSYFIGQDDPTSACQYSSRIAVQYNPILATAPAAEAAQVYCEGATIADLEAEGINRWYSTATSNPFLDPSTPLVDGATYYASQIVNRTNSSLPPCESQDRTAVTVTITEGPDAGADNTGTVCFPDVSATFPSNDAVRNYYLSLLEDGVPTNGTFSPSIAAIVSQYQADEDGLGDFTVTYTIGEDDCQDSVDLTISIIEETPANAGSFADVTDVCAEDMMIDLTALTNNDTDATSGGTFTGTGVTDNQFDPSIGEGEYEITYTVDETSAPCVTGSDSTTFMISVSEANAGDDIVETICSSDLENPAEFADEISSLLEGRDTDGTFTPDLATLYAQYQADLAGGSLPQTYLINYAVVDGSCSDEANIEITVNPSPDAGEDATVDLLPTDDPIDLFEELGGTPETGGTWSSGDGTFDPATDTPGAFTYTVSNSFGCEDSATVTVNVETTTECEGAAGNDNTGIVCSGDVSTTFPSNDEVRKYYLNLLDSGVQRNGTFSPSIANIISQYQADEDGLGDFTVTYTITTPEGCTDSTNLTIRVIEEGPGEAGSFDDIADVCSNDASIDLTNLTNNDPEANLGGAFSGEGVTDNNFDPSIGSGTYTITYSVDDTLPCVTSSDDTTFTITVIEGVDAGENATIELSRSDDPINLYDVLGGTPDTGGTWTPGDGTFDPSTDTPGSFEYTVTNGNCADSAIVTVIVVDCPDAPNAGDDNFGIVCLDDVSATFPSIDATRNYFLGLLDAGVARNGTFEPTITQIIDIYNADEDGLGDFTVTYILGEGDCTSSANLTVRIVEEGPANAGSFDDITDICSTEDAIDLNDLMNNDPEATIGGTFSGEGVSNNEFDPSIGEGTYTITYTVDETTPCTTGSDSTTFTIMVSPGESIGEDVTEEVCELDVQDLFPDVESVRNFYLNLLDEGVARTGTFNPSIQQVVAQYQADEDGLGDFSTVYTLASEGNCPSTITLTASIFEADDIDIEQPVDQSLCLSDDAVNLSDYLVDGTLEGGSFAGYEDGTFDPSIEGEGTYNITYTVRGEGCSQGTTTFTITVTDAAYAGEDMEFDVCMNAGAQDLYTFLSVDADMDGEFTYNDEVITDGIMDPSAFEAGEYEVLYTVTAINDCGDDTATFTITVLEAADAPELNDISFCAIQNPTGLDLIAENANLTFYSDEDLTMMVTEEEELVAGTYYATATPQDGCESEAASFTVTINDPGTPTIDDANPVFCEYDDATIADLNDAVDQTSNVTWFSTADGTESLSTGTPLQDGVTYYASLYDPETDCDSSARLAVTVTIEECPLLFPEGISPNGDGRNDIFDIENIEREYPNYTIEIYNRWGKVVYKGNANTPEWDGTATESGALGDDVLPVGVYFYLLDFNDGVTSPRRGKVYLSR